MTLVQVFDFNKFAHAITRRTHRLRREHGTIAIEFVSNCQGEEVFLTIPLWPHSSIAVTYSKESGRDILTVVQSKDYHGVNQKLNISSLYERLDAIRFYIGEPERKKLYQQYTRNDSGVYDLHKYY